MDYVKYTKTATFLFPLLGIPKGIFYCDIKNSFGGTKYSTRFYNAYIGDCKVDNYKEGFIFLVTRAYQDSNYDSFYDTMTSFENYVDDYERGNYVVFIFSILDKFKIDYTLIMSGTYSKICRMAKQAIIRESFYSGNPTTIPLILSKSEELKKGWEKRLNAPLGNQEVWSIIMPEKEKLCDDVLEEIVPGHQIIEPNREFER